MRSTGPEVALAKSLDRLVQVVSGGPEVALAKSLDRLVQVVSGGPDRHAGR